MDSERESEARTLFGDRFKHVREAASPEEVAGRLDRLRADLLTLEDREVARAAFTLALDAASEAAAELHADSRGEPRAQRRQRETKRLNRRLESDVGAMAVARVHLDAYLDHKRSKRKKERNLAPRCASQAAYTLRQIAGAFTPAEEAPDVAGTKLWPLIGMTADRLAALDREDGEADADATELDADVESLRDCVTETASGHRERLKRDMRLDDVDAAVSSCPELGRAIKATVEEAEPLFGWDDFERRGFLNSVGLSEEIVWAHAAEPESECGAPRP